MRVALYMCAGSGKRAIYLADAMRRGLLEHGIKSERYNRFKDVCADVAIAYGWSHREIFKQYKEAGAQFAYFDLGYWNRRPPTAPMDGHYRLAMNDWDTATNMPRGVPDDRLKTLEADLKPRQKGRDVVIACMSIKAVRIHGYDFREWENGVRKQVEQWGLNRTVVMRDKPNKKAKPMPAIADVLKTAHMLITHHSNAAVDALVNGIPTYAKKGVGSLWSAPDLTKESVENPYFPCERDRRALLADVAYAQWKPEEMRSGAAWEFMKTCLCA